MIYLCLSSSTICLDVELVQGFERSDGPERVSRVARFLYLTRAKRIQAISICKGLQKKVLWNDALVHTELCVKSISCKLHGLLIKRCCVFSF